MSVTKTWFLAAALIGLLGESTRGDAILTLGSFSSSGGSIQATSPSGGSVVSLASATQQGTGTMPSATLATTSGQNLAPASPPAVQATFAPSPAPAVSSAPLYDAFINFGSGPFSNSTTLSTANPQAWYDSPKIAGLFGGTPTASQVASFDATVLQRVQQAFSLSGVPVKLTDDPMVPAAHMLSVVSNAVNPSMTGAIGMTNIGGNGFHFIDNAAPYAGSVDQLEWIVAHNVAHELMLAFGVPEINDQTGKYIDSTVGQMSMFLNPKATFSPGAVGDLLASNFQQTGSSLFATQAQLVDGANVPEPATLAGWTVALGILAAVRRARSRRSA